MPEPTDDAYLRNHQWARDYREVMAEFKDFLYAAVGHRHPEPPISFNGADIDSFVAMQAALHRLNHLTGWAPQNLTHHMWSGHADVDVRTGPAEGQTYAEWGEAMAAEHRRLHEEMR